jgi:hypothetical protein
VTLNGATKMVPATTPGTIEDRGTVRGTPFGRGSVTIVGKLAAGSLDATFRMRFPRGSVYGNTTAPFTIEGTNIHFRGTSRITGGTGAFRGITSGELVTRDDNTLDGQNGVLLVTGSATF